MNVYSAADSVSATRPNTILDISHVCKKYPLFELNDVSFSLNKGSIMGFIGRNGAGKSTTLKALFNIVHPDSGAINFFGLAYAGNEQEIKNRVAFSAGAFEYYQNKPLKTITDVTRRFYSNWDQPLYERYLADFKLDERKTPAKLSEGMKVKYALCLALSHNAELLIFDEPTSGLDPVSREEVLEIFLGLARQGKTILFSTHIMSDLEKCADSITYIQNGRILDSCAIDTFMARYALVSCPSESSAKECGRDIKGVRMEKAGVSVLVAKAADETLENISECFARINDSESVRVTQPTLEEIMVHLEAHAQQTSRQGDEADV